MKRSLTILMMLALGLFVFACEVEDDTTDTVAETVTDVDDSDVDTDPCLTGVCSEACAVKGDFDADCFQAEAECVGADAQAILTAWFEGAYTDVMSPNTRNCDWTPLICDTQFRCNAIHCFCDPDCYVKDADGNYETPPSCSDDGHCDSWCPTGGDVDCAGDADDGKYCG